MACSVFEGTCTHPRSFFISNLPAKANSCFVFFPRHFLKPLPTRLYYVHVQLRLVSNSNQIIQGTLVLSTPNVWGRISWLPRVFNHELLEPSPWRKKSIDLILSSYHVWSKSYNNLGVSIEVNMHVI